MGLSNFPSQAEGVLPVLVINTVLSVALLKNMVRSVLQVVGAGRSSTNLDEESSYGGGWASTLSESRSERRISITRFKSLCNSRRSSSAVLARSNGGSCSCGGGGWGSAECCVCLCRFEAEEEVSELSCKHFFHKGCLEKWLDNEHSTCPLCRSLL